MLVSHRWLHAFFAEQGLWHIFTANSYTYPGNGTGKAAARSAAKRNRRFRRQEVLLQRVAPHIACFHWDTPAGFGLMSNPGLQPRAPSDPPAEASLACCLAALHPGRLTELQLPGYFASLGAASSPLRQLTSTTSLALYGHREPVLGAVLGMLGGRLCSLQLSGGHLTATALGSAVQLAPQLTALHIEAGKEWPGLGSLTRLRQLKQLVLEGSGPALGTAPIKPPLPASFPAGLERYSFESRYFDFQASSR